VAYVRFASVYRRFQGISDFVAALERLNRRGGAQGTTKVRLAVIS
jgi:transcriptional repressor NrdR